MHHVHVKKNQDKTLINLKKAQSQINTIIKMIEDENYCIDIMHQNMAAIGLLKSAHQMLMEDHLHSCFSDAMHSSDADKQEQMVEEILHVTKLVQK